MSKLPKAYKFLDLSDYGRPIAKFIANALKNTAFKRKEFMDEISSESSLLLESLAILAGGSDEPNDYKKGFDLVEDLKQKMNENRIKRLVSIGIDEDLANDISKAHTPNFM